MATNSTLTLRMDADLKNEAEIICKEMGITISAAMMIFLKRLVSERAIPFRVEAKDPFYSAENLKHLRAAAARMNVGKKVNHDIIEVD